MQQPPRKRRRKFALLFPMVGIAIASFTISGVLAATSININNGSTIEFGQGVAATNTCVTSLQTAITQTFQNSTNNFIASVLGIRGDFSNCASKSLRVTLLSASNTTLKEVVFTVVQSASSPQPATEILTTDQFKLFNISSDAIDAGSIKRITVTSETSS